MTSRRSASPPADIETLDPTEIAGQLRFAVVRLARVLRQQDAGGLSLTLGTTLAAVARTGPLTLGELATQEQVARPSITKAIDQLQARGLVERRTDDADRRVCRVQITTKGRRQLDANRTRRTAWLATRLRDLSPADLATLGAAATVLDQLVEPPECSP